jgi:adenine-specific DNA-methyltransferase
MIKYIGSKRTLLGDLVAALQRFPEFRHVIDLFSGTSRVGHALKRAGYRVTSNDYNAYAHALARCYVVADREKVLRDAEKLLKEFGSLPGREGYFTKAFCIDSRFFQPKNGARVDAIRDAIAAKGLDPVLEAVVLVSLMEAADRVDSTCGLQMAYLKDWAPRAHNNLELRMPDVLPSVPHGTCDAHQMDALDAVKQLEADVIYLDPPYNQHSYLSNYHIWETLIRWDNPAYYGIACKREDCRTRKSVFNLKNECFDAFSKIVRQAKASMIVVSFNNEGYLSRPQMESLLSQRGEVFVITKDFKRYVGAQIGIYNPQGAKVGKVSHLRNHEYIYVVLTEGAARRDSLASIMEGFEGGLMQSSLIPEGPTTVPELAMQAPPVMEGPLDAGISALLMGAPTLSSSEIQSSTGADAVAVRACLHKLAREGLIRTHGVRRGTRYEWIGERAILSTEVVVPDVAAVPPPPSDEPAVFAVHAEPAPTECREELRQPPMGALTPSGRPQLSLF